MVSQELIGVVDMGKTNAKFIVLEPQTGAILWSLERRCSPVEGSTGRQLDVHGIEAWLLSAIAEAPGKERIRALVPVAHGAAAVLISSSGEVLAAPDYEDPVFDTVGQSYRTLRDPFEATLSPFLPLGLNLGRQLYFLQQHDTLWSSCATILLYPQYWAWRLSGVMSSEVTSLGTHTDLWRPREARFSSLAETQGWSALLPPLRSAGDTLGTVSKAVAQVTGLDPACRILCGIHDSNASFLCHRVSRPPGECFTVISSGTWTVMMAQCADLSRLREKHDMLANVDALGTPVATARFMGGREYQAIAGNTQAAREPTARSLSVVFAYQALALPSFASAGGPFAGHQGTLVNVERLNDEERGALATLYCSLVTDLLLDALGASDIAIVDGPLSANTLYGSLLSALRPGSRILLGDNRAGPVQCAQYLCGYPTALHARNAPPLECAALGPYRTKWRRRVEALWND